MMSIDKHRIPVFEKSFATYYILYVIWFQNFSIIYIRMGFPRLAPDKQAELVPLLLKCLEGKPKTQQDR